VEVELYNQYWPRLFFFVYYDDAHSFDCDKHSCDCYKHFCDCYKHFCDCYKQFCDCDPFFLFAFSL
jgi:hypothetical protein